MKVASWTAVPCTLQLPVVGAINLTSPSQNMPRPFQLEGGKGCQMRCTHTNNTCRIANVDYELVSK